MEPLTEVPLGAVVVESSSPAQQHVEEERMTVSTDYGPVTVWRVLSKKSTDNLVPVVTLHGVGVLSHADVWSSFVSSACAAYPSIDAPDSFNGFLDTFYFVHIDAPGHEMGAAPMDRYPTLDEMAQIVITVMDALSIPRAILMGSGAGANVMCRVLVATEKERRVLAMYLNCCVLQTASWSEWIGAQMVFRRFALAGMSPALQEDLLFRLFSPESYERNSDAVQQMRSAYGNTHFPFANLILYWRSFLNRSEVISGLKATLVRQRTHIILHSGHDDPSLGLTQSLADPTQSILHSASHPIAQPIVSTAVGACVSAECPMALVKPFVLMANAIGIPFAHRLK